MWLTKKSYEIICIGSTSKDIFFPVDEGWVLETPEDIIAKRKIAFELGGKIRVKDRFEAVGGVAANVASGLARLGRRVAVYSCIGGDDMGQYIVDALVKEGVATNLLSRYDDAKTDLSAIVVLTQNGERTIFHNRDANERLKIKASVFDQCQWVFLSALNGDWKHNLAMVLSAKDKYGFSLAYNPGQHNIKDDAKQIFDILPFVNVLLLNKDEAIELIAQSPHRPTDAQLDNEQFLLSALAQAGATLIGMTDGRRGAWGYDGKTYWHCPIYTRDAVVDSTGAGDAFGSGFFAAHLVGQTLPVALQYGMINSGSVVGYYGAIKGLLTRNEIEGLLEKVVPQRLS